MPVVTLIAADHPHIDSLLSEVADAIGGALALGDGDVIATHVPAGRTIGSGADASASVAAWPIVTIHGSDRSSEKMRGACAAAESVVRAWAARHAVACGGVWTQWLTPLSA